MASIKRSPTNESNPELREEKPELELTNTEWLDRHNNKDGILLLGGTSVDHFRVRVAQSSLRRDMLPSFWSLCGILINDGESVVSAPFDLSDVSAVPSCNGIQECPIEKYKDPRRYPNIALIRFAETHKNVHRDIARVQGDRSIIDLPALMLPWLGFIWGASGSANPLQNGTGVPSAAFVETVFAMAGFELTPGLSSASSCPEAIWQSAKWWASYYKAAVSDAKAHSGDNMALAANAQEGASEDHEGTIKGGNEIEKSPALPTIPAGSFMIRQKNAAVLDPGHN
ncbi:hypothetical protein GGE65_007412 [Skermanella aerolata]|uniref:hypothetical protein n=1 Tax=Skermanella aerolata TaxID=393310 RepID=UPI003D1EA54F